METELKKEELEELKAEAVIIYTFKERKTDDEEKADRILSNRVSKAREENRFEGEKSELLVLENPEGSIENFIIAGLGEEEKFEKNRLREATWKASRLAEKRGFKEAKIKILEEKTSAKPAVEGSMIGLYKYKKYKTKDEDEEELKKVVFLCEENLKEQRKKYEEGIITSESVNTARDLQNAPSNDMTPEDMASEAEKLGEDLEGLSVEVYDEEELAEKDYRGILAVGGGSSTGPRIIVMKYRHEEAEKNVVLAGKGLCFDSGGISIKPSKKMEEMKYDMSGAASIIGVMKAVAELKPKINITGIIGTAINVPSAKSYKPGDIVKTKSGKTVEVVNTDAEGRIVLADLLEKSEEYNPDVLIDFATLTGACLVALGSLCAAVMGNDQELIDKVEEAGRDSGERVWQLPLWKEYEEDVKSDIADIKNVGFKREAGVIAGGSFLKEFVKDDTTWAHVDMAGTAITDRERFLTSQGGTGYGVRLFLNLLKKI